MSEKLDLHRADYQKFFDAINSGDMTKIETAVRRFTTPDFRLHHMRDPKKDRTVDEFLESFRRDSQKLSNQHIAFEENFSLGDMMAAIARFETVTKDTNEKQTMMLFWVDRFEGDKLAEEWIW